MIRWQRRRMADQDNILRAATPYVHWWDAFERPPSLRQTDDKQAAPGDGSASDPFGVASFLRDFQITAVFDPLEILGSNSSELNGGGGTFRSQSSARSKHLMARGAISERENGQLDFLALPPHAERPKDDSGLDGSGGGPQSPVTGAPVDGVFPDEPLPEGTIIVGMIDDAIAIGHPRFQIRGADGTWRSRVLMAWQQDAVYRDPALFGREISQREIEDALNDPNLSASSDPSALYRRLFPQPEGETMSDIARTLMARAGHGTHVGDLACGADPDVASDMRDRVRMVTVGLPARASVGMSGTFLELYVVYAMRRIVEYADALWTHHHGDVPGGYPVVINLSYGQQAGAKTGTSLIEQEFLLLQERRKGLVPVELVMPAGNDNLTRSNMRWNVKSFLPIPWRILPGDQSSNFVEVWTDLQPEDGQELPLQLKVIPPGVAPELVEWINPNLLGDEGSVEDYVFFSPSSADGPVKQKDDLYRVYLQVVDVPDVSPDGISRTFVALAQEAAARDRDGGPENAGAGGGVADPLLRRQRYVVAVRPTLNHEKPDAVALAGEWEIQMQWATLDGDVEAKQREVYMNVQVDQDMDSTSRTNFRSYFDNPPYRTHMPSGRTLDTYAYGPDEVGLAEAGEENLEPATWYWAVQRKGTQNSLANHKAVIAAAGYRASDGRPAPYSATYYPTQRIPAAIKGLVRTAPTAAFPTDLSPSLPGIRAAGTHAGAQVRLQGTSFAAPQATRWLVEAMMVRGNDMPWPVDGEPGYPEQLAAAAMAAEARRPARFEDPPPDAKIGQGRMPPKRGAGKRLDCSRPVVGCSRS